MKAIETIYSDYKFRSRLEARYAVFFDACGEKWEYEIEGYDLDEGDYYLPDFWLPRLQCFVEVKGSLPDEMEIRKCRKLQYHTDKSVILCNGLPNANDATWFCWDAGESGGGVSEWSVKWGVTDLLTLVMTDTIDLNNITFFTQPWESPIAPIHPWDTSFGATLAAQQAKQARFEHGERPIVVDVVSRPLRNTVDYDDLPF